MAGSASTTLLVCVVCVFVYVFVRWFAGLFGCLLVAFWFGCLFIQMVGWFFLRLFVCVVVC